MRALFFTDPHRGFNQNTSIIMDKVLLSIDPSSFDIVIVSGDWGTMKLKHVKGAFKAFRRAYPDKVILGVLGNHDLWDKNIKSLASKFQKINEFAIAYDIHLLEKNPYESGDYLFLGFNGWYAYDHNDTNDMLNIFPFTDGESTDNYLRRLADDAVNFMIDYPKENKTVISVTHFPCIEEVMDKPHWNGHPKHGEILLGFSDMIVFGHTHQAHDNVIDGVRVLNVGADYNKIKYKIVDLSTVKKNRGV